MVLTGPVPIAECWLMSRCGLAVSGPAGAPVAEPVEQDLVGELVDRADSPGDDEPAVAEVGVVELGGADGAGAGGVDRGEHEHQPGGRGRGGLGGLVTAWHLLSDPTARYRDLGPDWHATHVNRDKKIRSHLR